MHEQQRQRGCFYLIRMHPDQNRAFAKQLLRRHGLRLLRRLRGRGADGARRGARDRRGDGAGDLLGAADEIVVKQRLVPTAWDSRLRLP